MFFNVIWLFDITARAQKPRMMVCISPSHGEFLRINNNNTIRPCVPLQREPHHQFLDHDSYIECNILEIDEFLIDESLRQNGIAGIIHEEMKPIIYEGLRGLTYITSADKDRIKSEFDLS